MSVDVGPIWTPSPERVERARITQFRRELQGRGVVDASVTDSHGMQRWSVQHPAAFWAEIWRAAAIMADGPGTVEAPWSDVLVGGERMAPPDPQHGPRWFTGTRLNFAEHLLRRRDAGTAIVSWNEHGAQQRISFAELAAQVAATAAALSAAGVGVGDRVVGYLPNLPQAVVAMLAATSLGAMWSSCSPDFGTKGVLDRFGQIAPKVLIAADGYWYAGKQIDCLERLREIAASLPSLAAVWVVPYVHATPELTRIPGAVLFTDVLAQYAAHREPTFVRLPFDHPLYIMYSSGTTGLPKCMVHGAGGTLLQHWKELALHTDLGPDDAIFYFTTCGWMMWNWLVSALAVGATVVLYDGAPLAHHGTVLWDLAAQHRVHVFGTSARFLAMSEKLGVRPRETHDLSALRLMLSTGSPLSPSSFDYVADHVKPGLPVASISGGTDLISCFALGNPLLPVWRGELQAPGLGMAVEVFDDDGRPVRGQPGELVCTRPFPSMPVAFWDDPDGARYRAAYFEVYPNVWRHGDWAEITERGGLIIHGRSDATLNPGGVRIGTAEIYRQVEQCPEILESVVVGFEYDEGTGPDVRVALFVRAAEGAVIDDAVQERLRRRLRDDASPHHVPKIISVVADIPRTVSGKISEIAVREALHGRPVRNTGALANPESLTEFAALGVTLRG